MAGKNDGKKEMARVLYINGNLTQKEICLKAGISREATLSNWIKKEEWDKYKISLITTRQAQISMLYAQINDLQKSIESRPVGSRSASAKEADIISKLTTAIRKLEVETSARGAIEVGTGFLEFVRKSSPSDEVQLIARVYDEYIKSLF